MADRLITINIRRYIATQPRTKRARKAVKYVRERVAHFTKIKPENIRLGSDLNALIFKEYSRSMKPLKLRVKIGTDTADVLPFKEGEPEKAAQQTVKKEEKKPFVRIKKQEAKPEGKREPAQAPQAQANPPAKQATPPKQAEKSENK